MALPDHGGMTMRSKWIFATLVFAAVPAAPAPAAEPLVEQVRVGIEKGIRFLRNEERGRGNWEHTIGATGKPGGYSCLAVLALLNSGVKADDPIIQRALKYLRGLDAEYTYVVGLQTMVFAEVGDARDGPLIQRNVDWLIEQRKSRGKELRGWGYSATYGGADFSNSQYALLGLHAGRQAGARIDRVIWEEIERFYTTKQDDDGGWVYSFDYGNRGPVLTMTVAGLCSLHIVGLELNAARRQIPFSGIDPKCGIYDENKAIAKALEWLAAPAANGTRFSFRDQNFFYNAYGIERAGRLSGQRFLAGHDWYREGCEAIVGRQQEDGSWTGSGHGEHAPVVSTSFALLFLSKGRTPILISKFAYGPDEGWNNKHNDCRYLAEYASKELFHKQPLAWQTYDARRLELANKDAFLTEVGNLLQSPILYMNGHQAPRLTDMQKRLLMQYIDEGGFLFAEACCGRTEFAEGFRKLMADLFPDSPLKPLGPAHPIWTAHTPVPPDFTPLEGIEKGCKTIVIFSPQPLSAWWETNDRGTPPKRGLRAFQLAGNVIAYATGLEMPKPRLTEAKVFDNREDKRITRGFLKAAQIRHDGDWQPAPHAMTNLMRYLRGEFKLDVALQTEELRLSSPEVFQFKFLYMHGRRRFTFTNDELENLRANLKTGGLLLADACCGRPEFDEAFRAFAKQLFPEAKLEAIPTTDPLLGAEINGAPITTVRVRKERPDGKGPETEYRDAPPYLEGIRVNGRWVVVYSKYDLGCALENHQSSDCLGHDKASALKLAGAAVLYELKK
jgi:Domain of unknown function (DUF4159)